MRNMWNDHDEEGGSRFHKLKSWVIAISIISILVAILVAMVHSPSPAPYKEFQKAQSK